jgi:predicted Zn-dependent protease
MQRAWAAVVVALFALVGAAVWIYVEGLPVAARWIADALPPSFEERIGERVLGVLDERQLRPSSLPAERQQKIAKRFRDAAGVAAPGVEARLLFRAGPVNAFALPGGTIVVFDALVTRANDDQLLGVLGHELGHVAGHHSMRQLVQAVGVGAIAGLLWGDLSGAASNVPLVLGAMRYGRAFEQEADHFALAFLRANGVSARPLLEFFERMEQPDEREGRTRLPEFLSTHPDTGSRIDWLRGEVEADEKLRR